jgi:hypothetical protein
MSLKSAVFKHIRSIYGTPVRSSAFSAVPE